MKDFRSVDLEWAVAFGWAQHHNLNVSELQVLSFISVRGMRSEPGMAFSWFPLGGQEWWAVSMCMEAPALRKTLSRLRQKALVVNLQGSSSDARFRTIKGYGIPETLLVEMRQWSEDRSTLSFINTPYVREKITPSTAPSSESEHTNSNSDTSPENTLKTESEHTNSNSGITPENVTTRHKNVTTRHIDNALTRTFAPYSRDNQEETENPSGSRNGALRAPSKPRETEMRIEDDWSVPKDEMTPLREGGRKRNSSGSQKPPAKVAPTTRVVNLFYDLWTEGREQRKGLTYPWSTKLIAVTRFKGLIEEHGEEQTAEMVRIFFRLVSAGKIPLKAEELWKDFWFNRAKLEGMARRNLAAPATAQYDEAAEIERMQRLVESAKVRRERQAHKESR